MCEQAWPCGAVPGGGVHRLSSLNLNWPRRLPHHAETAHTHASMRAGNMKVAPRGWPAPPHLRLDLHVGADLLRGGGAKAGDVDDGDDLPGGEVWVGGCGKCVSVCVEGWRA